MAARPLHDPTASPMPLAGMPVRTATCCRCACRCAIRVHVREGETGPELRCIEGTAEHPLNQGVIRAKGSSRVLKQYSPARLTQPLLRKPGRERGGGEFEPISWQRSFALLTERLQRIRSTDPTKFALFTGRDQMRKEDGSALADCDKRIGCKYCSWACPDGARELDEERQVMTKCNLCVDPIHDKALPQTERKPACVMVCPTPAGLFGEIHYPQSVVSTTIHERAGCALMPEWDTRPANHDLPRHRRSMTIHADDPERADDPRHGDGWRPGAPLVQTQSARQVFAT